MVNAALDFDATYEELEKSLFYLNKNSVCTMWEYINMGFQDMSVEIREAHEDQHMRLLHLNGIYQMILLFRTVIKQDIKMLDAVKAHMPKF